MIFANFSRRFGWQLDQYGDLIAMYDLGLTMWKTHSTATPRPWGSQFGSVYSREDWTEPSTIPADGGGVLRCRNVERLWESMRRLRKGANNTLVGCVPGRAAGRRF
jgi:hypothetical protein